MTNKNPFLESGTDRFSWCDTQSCNEGHMAYERGAEHTRKISSGELKAEDIDEHLVGYFVGCTSAYRNNELSTATCRILEKM